MKLERCTLHKLRSIRQERDEDDTGYHYTAVYMGNEAGNPLLYITCEHEKTIWLSDEILLDNPTVCAERILGQFTPGILCQIE